MRASQDLLRAGQGDDWKPREQRKKFKVSVKILTGGASLPMLPQDLYTIYHITQRQSKSDLGVQLRGLTAGDLPSPPF